MVQAAVEAAVVVEATMVVVEATVVAVVEAAEEARSADSSMRSRAKSKQAGNTRTGG